MRSLLIHNPAAGYGQIDADQLVDMLARHGHDVTYLSSDVDDLALRLDRGWDLIIVAGGDGTTTRIAKLCAGRRTPLAILPLGSANNLARSLGHYGAIEDLIKAWHLGSVQAVDLGEVTGNGGRVRFAESFGIGLIAATIMTVDKGNAHKARAKFKTAADRLAAGMKALRTCLRKLDPFEVTVHTPEGARTDSVLWAEAVMVNSVGPGLSLFESHDPADGMVSYVLLPAHEREVFDSSLTDRMEGRLPSRTGLVSGSARALSLSWKIAPAHLDGELVSALLSESPLPQQVEVSVLPNVLRVLRMRYPAAS